MRALLLLLLMPTAGAWSLSVEAPPLVESGVAFEARVCIDAPAEARVELKVDLLWNGSRVGHAGRAGRYVPAVAGCANVTVSVDDVAGVARLEAKARPEGGEAKARASVDVRLARSPVPFALVDAYGPPFRGIVIESAGEAPATLVGLALGGAPLPDLVLAPGERVFLGERAPPDVARWARHEVRFGTEGVALTLGARVVASIAAPDPAAKRGIEGIAPEPMRVAGRLTALATPDAGVAPLVDLVGAARAEVLLEGYQLTSPELGGALLAALDRGVGVRVLLEGAPVGGVPEEESALVSALVAGGADVLWMEGAPARFRTQHAKVIVVDEEHVLVSSENFRASSFPAAPASFGTRGYALLVENASLARAFARVLRADAAAWPDVRAASAEELPPPVMPAAMPPGGAGPTLVLDGAWNVTPILSPGGGAALSHAFAAARERIDAQVLFAEPRSPLLDALVDAARRNVTVRLLLDGHVDDGGNAAAAARLNAIAARESLPLVVRVDDAPRTLHAKMALLDGRAAYVGSMNWGRASMEDNREAGLLVEDADLAAWLAPWFEKDWEEEERGAAAAPGREVPGAAKWMVLLGVGLSLRALPSRASCRRRAPGRTGRRRRARARTPCSRTR